MDENRITEEPTSTEASIPEGVGAEAAFAHTPTAEEITEEDDEYGEPYMIDDEDDEDEGSRPAPGPTPKAKRKPAKKATKKKAAKGKKKAAKKKAKGRR